MCIRDSILVKLTNPQFEGQTKAKLGNSDMRTLVDSVVSDKLEQFLEESPACLLYTSRCV